MPVAGVDVRELAEAAQFASLADETPEGRSIVVLAKRQFDLRDVISARATMARRSSRFPRRPG